MIGGSVWIDRADPVRGTVNGKFEEIHYSMVPQGAWYRMYRVGVEAILGLTRRGGALHIDPCIPKTWPKYELTYKAGRSEYRITVENPNGVNRGVTRIELDGVDHTGRDIAVVDDGAVHQVRVVLG